MSIESITWWQTALALLLVGVAMGVSTAQHLGLERSIVWASARAALQLAVVGVVLTFVFDSSLSLWLAGMWIFVMVTVGAWVVCSHTPEMPSGFGGTAWVAFGAATMVTVGVLFGFGFFAWEARTLIPIAGMVVGNSMTATVVAARRTVEGMQESREAVEARLALGFTAKRAARPTVRSALRTALIPQIESTKNVGLVYLPGAMTGLILAGVSPRLAVQVQLAVMYLVLGSTATSATVIALGVSRRLFSNDHRLVLPTASPEVG